MTEPGGEFAFIDWLRQRTVWPPFVALGPGDDAAVIRPTPDRSIVVTTDMLMDGTCFRLDTAGPQRVGRKAMAVNLSDIAAMAAVPRAALVAVALPVHQGMALARDLYDGMRAMADSFGTAIVGGDTNSWNGPLVIAVTLLGEASSKGVVRRSGAREGDWVLVTGALGGSILEKHLDFTPRVREALQLNEHVDLHAMIDVSDGLAADLHHIAQESQCGISLRADAIPIAADISRLHHGRSPLEHALHDGEDFELAFAVSPNDGRRLVQEQPIQGVTLTHIGHVVREGLWLEEGDQVRPLEPRGYVHPLG